MQYCNLKIGDVVDVGTTRRPFGAECDPAWYILTVGRTRTDMVVACAWLERNGATEAWFPEETARRNRRVGPRTVREIYSKAIVPGLVFMQADLLPIWDVLLTRNRIRPMQIGERPVIVSEAVMAQMVDVPTRIANLRAAVLNAETAARDAKAPVAGSDAVFISGPFEGLSVHVQSVSGGMACVMVDNVRINADVAGLERKD
jgi:hypothetical protein